MKDVERLKEQIKERIEEKVKISQEAEIMIIEMEELMKLPDISLDTRGKKNTDPNFHENTIAACQQIMAFSSTQINELEWVLSLIELED